MNAQLEAVILGIIANGISTILARCTRKGWEAISGDCTQDDTAKKSKDIGPIIKSAIGKVSYTFEWNNEPRVEEVCLFLDTPEVENIVRQIYSANLLEADKIIMVREEFILAFLKYFQQHESITPKEAIGELFQVILSGCEAALNSAIDNNMLSAHEAKSSFRFRMLRDDLHTIRQNLALLSKSNTLNVQEIIKFEKQYREQIAQRHSHITIPHFGSAKKVFINEIYVSPNFEHTILERDRKTIRLNYDAFLSNIYRVVLLGNPGGGKSTLSQKLCYDFASDNKNRNTPILVVLREYGQEKKAHRCSILEFIESTANSKYQVKPPQGALEYLLLNGRAFVIFDGLDELLDTSYRQEISEDVESFCNLYPSVPVLVTSREVGYEQAPLDNRKFEEFRLGGFEPQNVTEYVTKWFNLDSDLTENQKTQKVESFTRESAIIPDLRSNPLMLALLCNIYRGENYIPRNRPDVYEKCATMLFEQWDKGRSIKVELPFDFHIRPAMMYLAHWIYTRGEMNNGVTRKLLITKTSEYLLENRYDDKDKSEVAARDFVDFCKGRAWVFTDTGTTKEGEPLYQFTHTTFLEYFTANHLTRVCPTPQLLGEVLLPRIIKREWDVVAQLAFQIQNRNIERAGDQLLSQLLYQFTLAKENKDKWNLLSFAVRCLAFIVPSPKVLREIVKTVFDNSIHIEKSTRRFLNEDIFMNLFGNLLCAAAENRDIIADAFYHIVLENLEEKNEQLAIVSLETILHLTSTLGPFSVEPTKEASEYWFNFTDNMFKEFSDDIKIYALKDFGLCRDLVWRGTLPLRELIKVHGIRALFRERQYIIFPFGSISITDEIIFYAIRRPYPTSLRKKYYAMLEDCADAVISTPPPWVAKKHTEIPHWRLRDPKREDGDEIEFNTKSFFGFIVLSLILIEGNREEMIQVFMKYVESNYPDGFQVISSLRNCRKRKNTRSAKAIISAYGFNPAQREVLLNWATQNADFIKYPPKKKIKSV